MFFLTGILSPNNHYDEHLNEILDSSGQRIPSCSTVRPSVGIPKFISATPVSLNSAMELFRNERYFPLSGFCCNGLLPNDRGPVSNEEGSYSWKTLSDATLSLLSYGILFII